MGVHATICLDLAGKAVDGMKVFLVDDDHNFEEQAVAGSKFTMKGNSFALVKLP